jgi:hypothetical protein
VRRSAYEEKDWQDGEKTMIDDAGAADAKHLLIHMVVGILHVLATWVVSGFGCLLGYPL